MLLSELALRLGCRLEGDGAIDVSRVASLDDAGPTDVTFLANSRYAARLSSTRAAAVIADESVTGAPCAVLRTGQVYLAFAEAVRVLMAPASPAPGISGLATIDPTAELGPDVSIGPFVAIGPSARVGARTIVRAGTVIGARAVIGDDCDIHSHVNIRDGVMVGHRVVLQCGATLGADGFGFARRPDGTHQKIPQVGQVVIV